MFNKIEAKNAFTLAEVLITLVIIGVVAALTIPAAINKYQKQQTISLLKKTFSDFSQAVRLSVPKYGDPVTWDYSLGAEPFFNRYLKPNFVKAREMTLDRNEILYQRLSGRIENMYAPLANGAIVLVLNSGVIIYVSAGNVANTPQLKQKCYMFDINGLKKPNIIGRDLFSYCLDGEKGYMVPFAIDDYQSVSVSVEKSREVLKDGPSGNSYQCNTSGRGMWCAALIIKDGWQIKDDYPWK